MQTDDEVEILADIPGLCKDDILVDIERNAVTLHVRPPSTSAAEANTASPASPSSGHPARYGCSIATDDDCSTGNEAPLPAPHAWAGGAATMAETRYGLGGPGDGGGRVGRRMLCCERARPFARRSLLLPANADFRRAAASYRDGVLQLTIPKLEQSAAKRIRVA
eukprot:jgi/Ulvmu1/95/UM001_0098.1